MAGGVGDDSGRHVVQPVILAHGHSINKEDFFDYCENNLKEEGFTFANSFGSHTLQLADSGIAGSVIREKGME